MASGAALQTWASVVCLSAWLVGACAEGASEPRTSCERSSDCAAGWQCQDQRCQAPDAGQADAKVPDGSTPSAADSGKEAGHDAGPAKDAGDARDAGDADAASEPIPCPALQVPAHGNVTLDKGTNTGSKAHYSCDATFQLAGDATRTCQASGSWSGSAPVCTCSSSLQTDAMNCGACGTQCSSGSCAQGACVRRVFVTGSALPAMFGSLTQADAACKTLALGAGLSGTFKAWLSDATGSPSTRFTKGAGEYRRIDGVTVAKSWSDLSDGTLLQPINVSESGATAPSSGNTYVYTGTKPDGSLVTIDRSDPNGATCSNWTMQSDNAWVAYGSYSASDQSWSYGGMRQGCSMPLRLYCFEQ